MSDVNLHSGGGALLTAGHWSGTWGFMSVPGGSARVPSGPLAIGSFDASRNIVDPLRKVGTFDFCHASAMSETATATAKINQ